MKVYKYPEYSSCRWKKKYKTIDQANDAGKLQLFNNKYAIELYIYECEYCMQYHLTQQKTEHKIF